MRTRVAIIGGGPAGASAALGLARGGVDAVLFERCSFPRPKVCGEFISPWARPLLEGAIGGEPLAAAGATEVRGATLEVGRMQHEWALQPAALALSREWLDRVLLEAAGAAGARIEQPRRVAAVEWERGRPLLRLAGGGACAAEVVVHADGSGALDPAGPSRRARGWVALKCHLRAESPFEGVQMRAAPGAYLGRIGLEGGRGTLALAVRREVARRFGGDLDALARSLWPGFDAGEREGRWLACGVVRGVPDRPTHPRSFRIGNASGAPDPIGGEGIALAAWSGTTASELLASGRFDDRTLPKLAEELWRRHRRMLRMRVPACATAAVVLSRPALVRGLWPVLSRTRRPGGAWWRLSGKLGPLPCPPGDERAAAGFVPIG